MTRLVSRHLAGAVLILLRIGLACGPLPAQDSEEEAIRPFDRVILKNSNALEGIVETPGDLSVLPEIVIQVRNGGRMRIKREDIQEIIRRQTVDAVYKKKAALVEAEHDPGKRAQAEMRLGIWCKTPLAQLDGAAPRVDSALEHLLHAVELQKSLKDAYPHILSLLASRGPIEAAAGADLEREVRVARLAKDGGYDDPEIDYRLGLILAGPLGLPERAIPHIERVLAGGSANLGQVRRARALLADIHRARGEARKAVELYESAIKSPETDPSNFEPFYELARLHSRSGAPGGAAAARALFAKAQAIQPEFPEIQAELAAMDYRDGALPAAEKTLKAIIAKEPGNGARAVDLAILQLRKASAAPTPAAAGASPVAASSGTASSGTVLAIEKNLTGLLPRVEGADRARAHLALGAAKEARGDPRGGAAEYRSALEADPTFTEAKVALALVLLQLSEPDEARKIAEELLPHGKENPWLFAAASRILGEAEIAAGRTGAAVAHLERAIEVDARDVGLLERTGIILLREGKLDPGYGLLRRAREAGGDRPETLNAMGYYHYARGDMAEARKLFDLVLKIVRAPSRPVRGPAPPLPPARAYALRGKALIEDLERLEVFVADLEGPDSPTLNGWEETERYGIEISRKENRAVLSGKQAGAADGITSALLDRQVDVATFDRLVMRARPFSGKARLGLRLEGVSTKGGASAGLVFFRDIDGSLKCQVKTTQGDWGAPALAENEAPETGKPGFAPGKSWPEDGEFHALEIRRSSRGTGRTAGGFDLYLDGDLIVWNIKVAGLGGRSYTVGFSGQTDEIGGEYTVEVESFKVFRERPEKGRRKQF